MSDLLSPVLVVMENEVDAFWCFAGLMERMVSASHVSDQSWKYLALGYCHWLVLPLASVGQRVISMYMKTLINQSPGGKYECAGDIKQYIFLLEAKFESSNLL